MSPSHPLEPLTRARFDAVLFDLDGVLTETASVHAACWKQLFDEFLRERSEQTGEPFQAFDAEKDYRLYADGKPRADGVRDFLHARGIRLPEGEPDDPPGRGTVTGLGARKDGLVHEVLESRGVEAFEGSAALVRALRAAGFKTAVVSSSRNCRAVLEAARISDLFDARVDGEVAARRGLPGKPRPDTFLAAARDLGVEPARAVVVEDAISGVQAARDGGFALVIGVDRHGDPEELRASGADLVVSDLGELVGEDAG
jgi:beta-phosphoglucomutase family hydrolase